MSTVNKPLQIIFGKLIFVPLQQLDKVMAKMLARSDGVHHYDEVSSRPIPCNWFCNGADGVQNGLNNHSLEPHRIRDVHDFEIGFISEWVAQFREEKLGK